MKEQCDHLEEILAAEMGLIKRHIERHQYFMSEKLHREVMTPEAIQDFVSKYAWIMREFYCGEVCRDRYDCEMAQRYIRD